MTKRRRYLCSSAQSRQTWLKPGDRIFQSGFENLLAEDTKPDYKKLSNSFDSQWWLSRDFAEIYAGEEHEGAVTPITFDDCRQRFIPGYTPKLKSSIIIGRPVSNTDNIFNKERDVYWESGQSTILIERASGIGTDASLNHGNWEIMNVDIFLRVLKVVMR